MKRKKKTLPFTYFPLYFYEKYKLNNSNIWLRREIDHPLLKTNLSSHIGQTERLEQLDN